MAVVGDVSNAEKPMMMNGSRYLSLTQDRLRFMGFTEAEIADPNLTVVLKFDAGKHGTFIGIGKRGKH